MAFRSFMLIKEENFEVFFVKTLYRQIRIIVFCSQFRFATYAVVLFKAPYTVSKQIDLVWENASVITGVK